MCTYRYSKVVLITFISSKTRSVSLVSRFLLCGQSSENSFTAPPSPPHREHATIAASPVAMATGTMETDLNDSLNNSAIEAKRARSSSMIDDVHPSVRVAIEVRKLASCLILNGGSELEPSGRGQVIRIQT